MISFSKEKLRNCLRIKNTYNKLIISYTLISVSIILVLSLLLYSNFQRTTLRTINTNTQESIEQSINQLNLIQDRTFSIGQQLINDTKVFQALYKEEPLSEVEYASVVRIFNNIINTDSTIDSIFIYNSLNKQNVNTFGVENRDPMNETMMAILKNHDIYGSLKYIPHEVKYKSINGKVCTQRIVSVVIAQSEYYKGNESNNGNGTLFSAIIINLKADVIQNIISSTELECSSHMLVVDEDSNVLFDNKEDNLKKNTSEDTIIEYIKKSDVSSGMLSQEIDGEKYIVVYKNVNRNNYTFINIFSYNDLFHNLLQLKMLVIYLCFGVWFGTIVVSILSAKKIYSPLNQLILQANKISEGEETSNIKMNGSLNDIQFLENTFLNIKNQAISLKNNEAENLPIIKEALLIKAMRGYSSFDEALKSKFDDIFKHISLTTENGFYVVIIFHLDEYDLMQNVPVNVEESGFYLFSLGKLFAKAIAQYYPCEPIECRENNLIYLVMIKKENKLTEDILQTLKTVHENLQSYIQYKISCAVGMPVKAIENINRSYSNAAELLKNRLVNGYGLFYCHDVNRTTTNDTIIFVEKEIEHLIQMINICNYDGVERIIKKIITDISACQYDYIMLIMNQILLDIVQTARRLFDDEIDNFNFNNLYVNLNRIDNLDEIEAFLILYSKAIIKKIDDKRTKRQSTMIEEAIVYIKEHYNEYELTAERLSERANITSGYFGKLFNEYTGRTINEFIVQERLNHAKELLIQTNKTVGNISEEVGFNNSTYFMTVFKKNTGLTPNQFRKKNLIPE